MFQIKEQIVFGYFCENIFFIYDLFPLFKNVFQGVFKEENLIVFIIRGALGLEHATANCPAIVLQIRDAKSSSLSDDRMSASDSVGYP